MGVIVRPRFGCPCYDGCGRTVPTQRMNFLATRAAGKGEAHLPSDRICVDCEKNRQREGGATVTRRPPRR